jgi:hypothetical protein
VYTTNTSTTYYRYWGKNKYNGGCNQGGTKPFEKKGF